MAAKDKTTAEPTFDMEEPVESAPEETTEAAPEETTEAAPEETTEADPDLVCLGKDGETIFAHPVQVPLWQAQGWQIVEE